LQIVATLVKESYKENGEGKRGLNKNKPKYLLIYPEAGSNLNHQMSTEKFCLKKKKNKRVQEEDDEIKY
jgi:hypothetical protein